jgi:hypothetical protein
MSMMPRVDGVNPGPAGLARRGAVAGVCVALLAVGCGSAGPGSHGRSGTSAASPGTAPGGGGPASPTGDAAALARGHWSVLAASPLGSRQGPVVAWTGQELLEIGGWGGTAGPGQGAAFDPADGRWRPIAPAPVPAGALAASAWTGSRLFVFGGQLPDKTTLGPAAGLYDPASDTWTVTAAAPFGKGLRQLAAVRAGWQVVVAGVAGSRVEAASYDPATGKWRRQDPPLPAAHPALGIALVAAAGRVIIWSLWGRMQQTGPGSFTGYSGVDVRALAAGRWRDVTGGWPQHQTVPPPLFTGGQILVPPGQIWCGACSHPFGGQPGLLADPGTLAITRLPRGPLDDTGPVMVWTGAAALAINPGAEIGGPVTVRPGDMAAWDPASGAWRRLPSAPGPLQDDATPAWTGRELLAITPDGTLLSFTP